jgi:hypothetical protein
MIIGLDSDNPKPLMQKIQELILKKLFIKVDDEKIFINKVDFIGLILKDIIAIAQADFNIDAALIIALKDQTAYQSMPDTKRNELDEAQMEFFTEIEAYRFYLDAIQNELCEDEDEIYMGVLTILNSEIEILERKLHKLMMQSLNNKIENDGYSEKIGNSREELLNGIAFQIKVLALSSSITEAIKEFDSLMPTSKRLKESELKAEIEKLTKFSEVACDEIAAYKMALSLLSQNAEFPMILATVKQLLSLEEQS